MIRTAKRQSLTTKRAGHSGHCISFTDPSSLKSWLIWKKSTGGQSRNIVLLCIMLSYPVCRVILRGPEDVVDQVAGSGGGVCQCGRMINAKCCFLYTLNVTLRLMLSWMLWLKMPGSGNY